ncbi:MAG: metallophosphoesterase [Chloroflexi bacterium]|nr:metallophosphoesterase [Chloroflexota bacterium]
MIIAVLADLHSNLAALHVVLEDAKKMGAGEYWCLGDVVGYGPWPLQVWQRLTQLDIPRWGWIAGNHDWALVGRLNNHIEIEGIDGRMELRDPMQLETDLDGQRSRLGFFHDEAGIVIEMQKEALSGEATLHLRQALNNLPVVASPRRGIYLTHGRFMQGDVLDNIMQYTFSTESAKLSWDTLKKKPFPRNDVEHSLQVALEKGEWDTPQLLFVGHTHVPSMWRCQSARGQLERFECCDSSPPAHEWLRLNDLETCPVCVNPGSVGQPRDYSGLTRYALLDWDPPRPSRIRFQELTYDYAYVQEVMRNDGYPQKLIDILGKR